MIVVIFEVQFVNGKQQDYFALANSLRSDLMNIEGFISAERFESVTTVGKFVSISYWQDLESVKVWRNQLMHRNAQHKGHNGIISDFHLKVASVLRDYTSVDRQSAPDDSNLFFQKNDISN